MSILIPKDRVIYPRLLIGRSDGITWEDYTAYLKSVRVSLGDISSIGTGDAGVDGVIRQMSFFLRNDGVNNFSPLDRNSSFNTFGGVYSPLLHSQREVSFSVAIKDPGVAPIESDYIGLFHGVLGAKIKPNDTTVEVEAWDLARRLARTYIKTVKAYAGDAEDVIQAILNDNGYATTILSCPVSPGYVVTKYQPSFVTVWDALQTITACFGWYLGYLWDFNTKTFKLTLLQPPRTKSGVSADYSLTWTDDFYKHDLETSDDNIRNDFTVHYLDRLTSKWNYVQTEDAASIATYGRLPMAVKANEELIGSSAEALTMAQAMKADLKTRSSGGYPVMDISGKTTSSASTWRALSSVCRILSRLLPRSPTVGLICARASRRIIPEALNDPRRTIGTRGDRRFRRYLCSGLLQHTVCGDSDRVCLPERARNRQPLQKAGRCRNQKR